MRTPSTSRRRSWRSATASSASPTARPRCSRPFASCSTRASREAGRRGCAIMWPHVTTERRRVIRIAAAVLAYLAAAWIAGILTLPPNRVFTFRPPNALLLALALVDTPGRAWIYALATVPANPTIYTAPFAWLAIAGYTIANAIEVGIAAALVRRLVGRAPRFDE